MPAYGPGPRQFGEWWAPDGPGPFPLVMLVHGGYWRPAYDLSLENDVAQTLQSKGFLVWNVEYSPAGSTWPQTLADVAAAYAYGAADPRVDPARIAVVGHSAGGHLALWLASASSRTTGPTPTLVVGQAAVACLALAWEQRLGGGAVELFTGGPPHRVPERFAAADPLALLPTGVRTVLLHGVDDDVVPMAQSERYARASGAGLIRLPGGHFEHLDPKSAAVEALLRLLAEL
jgi:acetyl esterase/lipase